MDVFNDKIKPLFDSSGMTDKEIETALGLPRGVIYKWKSGKYKSYKDYLPQISNYFHVSIDYLMGIAPTKSPVEAEGIKEAPATEGEGLSAARQKLYDAIANLTDEQCTKLLGVVEWAKENK